MTDTEIRERAEAYIDGALAESETKASDEEREAAIERVEAATRELAATSREHDGEPIAC
jgi:hypothetical protein